MDISFHSHLDSNAVITTKFCTWHDSCAVVTCAKNCCDLMTSNRVMARRSFHRIWIAGKKPLVKQAPGWKEGWHIGCMYSIFHTICTQFYCDLFCCFIFGYCFIIVLVWFMGLTAIRVICNLSVASLTGTVIWLPQYHGNNHVIMGIDKISFIRENRYHKTLVLGAPNPKLICFSSHLAIVFAQSLEAWC